MSHASSVDFGKTAADYSRYRAGFPDVFFEKLNAYGLGVWGQQLLDLGTGTGTLARGFAQRGCNVTALDPAQALLDAARELDRQAGVQVKYVLGHAEETGLPAQHFDVVTAGQCWHWFDRPKAAQEVMRVLIPGGHMVIAHFDWIPLPGSVVEATEEVLNPHNDKAWNPGLMYGYSVGVYPLWLRDLTDAGFRNVQFFGFDHDVPYSHEAWRGRVRASSGLAARLGSQKVQEIDAELARMLTTRFPDEPLLVPHRVFALIGQKPV